MEAKNELVREFLDFTAVCYGWYTVLQRWHRGWQFYDSVVSVGIRAPLRRRVPRAASKREIDLWQ